MNQKLAKKIEKKLDQLSQLLDKIDEARMINSDDTDTWDPDTLYNLIENLKQTLQLLENQKIKGKYDELARPLYEEGLCTLVDSYQSKDEENQDF